MSGSSSNIVFDDTFMIHGIDLEGKRFDRVSRMHGRSRNFGMEMTLDYNNELLCISQGQTLSMALATSLSPVSAAGGAGGADADDKDKDVWRPNAKAKGGLDEEYDYVMYGKVYKFDGGTSEIVTAYASFGGLLLSLMGSFRHMSNIVLGEPIYILLRK